MDKSIFSTSEKGVVSFIHCQNLNLRLKPIILFSMDDQFVALLAQSAKLIKQATMFLQNFSDDEEKGKNDIIRGKCLEAITTSNDAMLAVSDKLLEKKKKDQKQHELKEKSETKNMNFARSNRIVTFDNIIGSNDAKLALYENLILPLSMSATDRKKIFQGVLSGGGNVLLYGPPGTGKTCLAQAAACEANAELFAIRPSEILRYIPYCNTK